MDRDSEYQLNKAVSWLLLTGGATTAATLLLKGLSDVFDSYRQKEWDKKLEKMSQPFTTIKLKAPMIKQKLNYIGYGKPKKSKKNKAGTSKLETTADMQKTQPVEEEKTEEEVKTAAEISPTMGNVLNWIAGATGLAGGWWLSNKLYNLGKQQMLKGELQDAKEQYYTSLFMRRKIEEELENKKKEKASSGGMYSFASVKDPVEMEKTALDWSTIGGTGIAAALAIILGSALMSRKALELKNPKLDPLDLYEEGLSAADINSPKLEFVVADDTITDDDLAALQKKYKKVKTASEFASNVDYAELLKPETEQFIIKLAAQLEKESLEGVTGVNDVIDAVALGYGDTLKSASSFDDMMDKASELVANTKKIASDVNRELAVMYIQQDPILSDIYVPYCCADVLDRGETFDKLASVIEDDPQAIQEFGCLIAAENIKQKKNVFGTKLASENLDKELTTAKLLESGFDDLAMHDAIGEILRKQMF